MVRPPVRVRVHPGILDVHQVLRKGETQQGHPRSAPLHLADRYPDRVPSRSLPVLPAGLLLRLLEGIPGDLRGVERWPGQPWRCLDAGPLHVVVRPEVRKEKPHRFPLDPGPPGYSRGLRRSFHQAWKPLQLRDLRFRDESPLGIHIREARRNRA